ncbi:MAG: flagellar hook-associated protein FlgK [Clostridia bacterium]|nr:flagellar hook-associated protein FlgK [Clostridia bacterium]
MSGTFFGFNTALKSLFAQQKAMNTTSHNIANASTPGYTRQQAVMAADFAFPVPSMNRPGGAGQVGTGVNVVEMRRIRDQFLDKQIRQELASLGYWEQMAETLKLAETTFIEPSDSGLSTLFNEFWVTWQELSKNAENVAIRTSLVETSVSLAEALNHAHSQLTTIVNDLKYVADIKADQVNTIAQQIDDLNKQIATIQLAGDAPNDLKDKRDLLLDELAKLVDFEIEETTVERPVGYKKDEDGNTEVVIGKVPDGQIKIYLGKGKNPDNLLVDVNQTDVQGNSINVRQIDFIDGVPPTFGWADGNDMDINNGQLVGIIAAISHVEDYITDLDNLAISLARSINELHRTGTDLYDENKGINFFAFRPGQFGASGIYVNDVIVDDINLIAASFGDDGSGDHNGSIALQISQLRPAIDRQYDQLVSRIGVKTNEAARRTDGQDVLIGQLEGRKESMSGVSLDEEMAMMLQFQRIYQASATMITTLDEMIQTILAMKR